MSTVTVTTAGFTAFDGRENELRNQGMRIFPGKTVCPGRGTRVHRRGARRQQGVRHAAREPTPSPCWTWPRQTIQDILPLGLKDHSRGQPTWTEFALTDLPDLGTTADGAGDPAGRAVRPLVRRHDAGGNYKFLTVADRGPNGEPTAGRQAAVPAARLPGPGRRVGMNPGDRPGRGHQPDPAHAADGASDAHLRPAEHSGRGRGAGRRARAIRLPYDPFGADLEGIVRAPDGTLLDVRRVPAVDLPLRRRRAAAGPLRARRARAHWAARPAGTYGSETLPAEYSKRVANRGFEAIAYDTDNEPRLRLHPVAAGQSRPGHVECVERDPHAGHRSGHRPPVTRVRLPAGEPGGPRVQGGQDRRRGVRRRGQVPT